MKTFTLFLNISISVAELMPRRGLYFSISVKYIYINVNFSANLHALLISLAYKSSQYCDMVPHSQVCISCHQISAQSSCKCGQSFLGSVHSSILVVDPLLCFVCLSILGGHWTVKSGTSLILDFCFRKRVV